MFWTQQGPPWGTGAPFLKPGLIFCVPKSEFSDNSLQKNLSIKEEWLVVMVGELKIHC